MVVRVRAVPLPENSAAWNASVPKMDEDYGGDLGAVADAKSGLADAPGC